MPVLPDLGTWPYKQALFDAVAEVFVDNIAGKTALLDDLLAATDWDSADLSLRGQCVSIAVVINAAVVDDFDRDLFGPIDTRPSEKGELGPGFDRGQWSGPLRNIQGQVIFEKSGE